MDGGLYARLGLEALGSGGGGSAEGPSTCGGSSQPAAWDMWMMQIRGAVRRWVGRTLKDLHAIIPKDWDWVLDEIDVLIEALPPEGDRRLYALLKQLLGRKCAADLTRTPLEHLRDLLLRLGETWKNYCLFDQDLEIRWTNDLTEQAIGRMKMRARTVRRWKTRLGMQTGMVLAETEIS